MMFMVVWERGSCNDGDHDSGREDYDTLEAAQLFIDANKDDYRYFRYTLIEGRVIGGSLP